MSTAEILSLISLISYIVAGICGVLAVFFWFFFQIPVVIGDLSGSTARKSIAKRRAGNERAGGKGYRPSQTNVNRGKLTDTMRTSRKPKPEAPKAQPPADALRPETGLLDSNKARRVDNSRTEPMDRDATAILIANNTEEFGGQATELLTDSATELLSDDRETGILGAEDQTQMLTDDATGLLVDTDATAPLNPLPTNPPKPVGGKKLTMLEDVMLIHTDEVI